MRPERCPHCNELLNQPKEAPPKEKEPSEVTLEGFIKACEEKRDGDAEFRSMWSARADHFASIGEIEAAATARSWAERGRPKK